MKKIFKQGMIVIMSLVFGIVFAACRGEKNIMVIAREQGSGTREAFDKVVTDGSGNYLEMKIDGKKVYKTTITADIQKETGNVISKVFADRYAIGYISLGSLNDTVKPLRIDGIAPSKEAVLQGEYVLQRPFVIMTNTTVTLNERTADFLSYLKSDLVQPHAEKAGCIYLTDPQKRANINKPPIEVIEYAVKESLPEGEKIVINGSTSIEKFIKKTMSGYAALYDRTADDIFTLDLQGSAAGKTAVLKDNAGRVIGLSSATVEEESIQSFNVCLDAVAVIVNKKNRSLEEVALEQLYHIFSGEIKKFSEIV